MPKLTIMVRDINTKRPVGPGAFIDLDGYTAITDTKGEAALTVPARSYTIRVTHRNYSPYVFSPLAITFDGILTVDLVPVVPIL